MAVYDLQEAIKGKIYLLSNDQLSSYKMHSPNQWLEKAMELTLERYATHH